MSCNYKFIPVFELENTDWSKARTAVTRGGVGSCPLSSPSMSSFSCLNTMKCSSSHMEKRHNTKGSFRRLSNLTRSLCSLLLMLQRVLGRDCRLRDASDASLPVECARH